MMRAVPAVAAGLLCALTGIRNARRLRQEAQDLRRWQELLRTLALILSEGTLSIPDALDAAADGEGAPDKAAAAIAEAMRRDPLLSPGDAFRACSLAPQERSCLERFFCRLGHGTAAMRCHAAEQAGDELALLAQTAAARAAKDAKLYQTLGLTGGACLTLLLL